MLTDEFPNLELLTKWTHILLVLTIVSTCLSFAFPIIPKGDLVVEVTGLRSTDGEIYLGLFDQAEGFPRDESRFFRADTIRNIKGNSGTAVFHDLEFGEYAVTLMHDENMDRKMNFNLIGMPKEGFGFSNNVKPTWRAPDFDETSFEFSKDRQKIIIKMIY